MINIFSDAQWLIRVTSSVAAGQGKKRDVVTMLLPPERVFNPSAAAESPKTRTSTPATTKEASDILIKCNGKTWFYGGTQNLTCFFLFVRPHIDRC
jgi:hypothetical protein